ncbi:LysR family transcriptional regulator [Pseudomonas gingeri NCPPB 3146 = LMG 5327]|uniref:LysR family transcriptional regulator n=3 Tax=Pseudomonas gingeri TaxID=117681 RepID=A0A7Y8CEJ1_9PSED|nr:MULTISPECIES: LysR family transcriptional regulator [Pseudomonas]NVZ27013.1 LysR family transcriptional regulator [Pseudomonas gingeri]NVZ66093.1 LysR family transcriptional regulator [Pseudomonas gingeri]NVZ78660.1 LysR family transcriptional regulator [Pseudomonas gingeri]NWA10034.1 LysR family transcriptional regulator [Pseudomonas gingeri]NWC15838.1 LysR family transcriptional regulator [Pseudomonas gingeri]
MDRLTAMRVFVTVVDLGSQSAAADHLELSRPVVSRYLAELEDWVGARLMHRTTRKLSLTAAGSETLPRCRQLLELSGDLQAAVSTPDEAPRGLLRISVSTSFGQAQLADAMAEYVRRFPGVSIDLQMLDRTVNLVDERIDLAIRTSNDLDPNLIARRLTVCRSVICASPAYLREHPAPRRVEELSQHNCLTHSYFGKSLWHFEQDGEQVSVPVQGNISANEASTLLRAVMAGAGISMLPTYQAGVHIHRGELVRLLPHAEPRLMNIYAVYASRKHMPATLRSMLDFLVQRFPETPAWDRGL